MTEKVRLTDVDKIIRVIIYLIIIFLIMKMFQII